MKSFFRKIVLIFSFFLVFNIFSCSGAFAVGEGDTANGGGTPIDVAKQDGTRDNQNDQKSYSESLKLFQTVGQGLYSVTWPILVVAGQFMDNAVVYGGFIGMDTLLWKIWNMIRMFANYIIGLILIFSIFTLFMGSKLQQFNPTKILPQIVVASVLVNASWFLMGAMIDAANIITYAVGTLPLKVAKVSEGDGKKNLDEIKIPTFSIKLQQNNENSFEVGIKDGGKVLPFCEVYQTLGKMFTKNIKDGGECAYSHQGEFYRAQAGGEVQIPPSGSPIGENTFKQVKESIGGMTAVLSTMYTSLINIGRTVAYPSGGNSTMVLDVVLKLIFLISLLIPLITLAIILIARAVMLWLFIIISPLIFLFTPIKGFSKFLGENKKLSSVCCLIFLPAIVVFALSISFVFLSYLNFDKQSLKKVFNIDGEGATVNINLSDDPNNDDNKITIKYKGNDPAGTSLFGDFSSALLWIIQTMFAVSFMWVIVFSALKSCKITRGIAESIQKFSLGMAKATPFVPVPGAGLQSIASLGKGTQNLTQLPGQWQQQQYTNTLQPAIDEIQRAIAGTEKKAIKSAQGNIDKGLSSSSVDLSGLNSSVFSAPGVTATGITKVSAVDDAVINSISAASTIDKDYLTGMFDIAKDSDPDLTLDDFINDKSKYKQEYLAGRFRKILQNDYILKQITVNQLPDKYQRKLIERFKKNFPVGAASLSENDNINSQFDAIVIFLYKELKMSKDEIIKLVASGMTGGDVKDKEQITQKVTGVIDTITSTS